MTSPHITIVTPSFNQAPFLAATIESVLGQQYPALEYIVIDGGSSDTSPHIIRQFGHLLTRWVSEADNGQADAINKGLRHATGDILCWLNSDDLLMPGALRAVVECFQQNPDVGVIYGNAILFNEESGDAGMRVAPAFDRERLKYDDFIVQPSTFWRRSVWEKTGELRDDLHFAFDWEWFLRASQHANFMPLNKCLSLYRMHREQKTTSRREERRREVVALMEEYAPPKIVAAMRDVAPHASSLDACCRMLQRFGLHRFRRVLFPRLYWKHGSVLVHEVLRSLL